MLNGNFCALVRTNGKAPRIGTTQNGLQYAFVNACIEDGNKEYPNWVSLKFVGKVLETLMNYADLERSCRLIVEGNLTTYSRKHEAGGQTIYSSECNIFVKGFRLIDGWLPRDNQPAQSAPQDRPARTGYQPMPAHNDDDLGPAFPSESSGMDEVPF